VHIERTVPNGRQAPGQARGIIQAAAGEFPDEVRERVALVVSEIVTNSVKYAGNPENAPIDVSLDVSGDHVRLEVRDHSLLDPTPESWREAEDVRWELLVIDGVATAWGKISDGGLWAEFEP